MNTTLIPAMTTFIATIGQTCRSELKTVSVQLATWLSSRKRSTRACSREKTSRDEPTQPRTCTHHDVMGAVWRTAGNEPPRCAPRSAARLRRPGALGLDVGLHGLHVQALHLADDVLEHRRGEGPGLGEDEDAVAEGHEHRDRGDVGSGSQGLLGL